MTINTGPDRLGNLAGSLLGYLSGKDNEEFQELIGIWTNDIMALQNAVAALSECRAALYGCRELVGSIGNIAHAIELADEVLK